MLVKKGKLNCDKAKDYFIIKDLGIAVKRGNYDIVIKGTQESEETEVIVKYTFLGNKGRSAEIFKQLKNAAKKVDGILYYVSDTYVNLTNLTVKDIKESYEFWDSGYFGNIKFTNVTITLTPEKWDWNFINN